MAETWTARPHQVAGVVVGVFDQRLAGAVGQPVCAGEPGERRERGGTHREDDAAGGGQNRADQSGDPATARDQVKDSERTVASSTIASLAT
jgi:hypothetical protein